MTSLEIEADGLKTFQAADVRQLVERGTRSTTKCLLWGLAGGTAAGIVAAFTARTDVDHVVRRDQLPRASRAARRALDWATRRIS